jgi:virulence factor
MDQVRVGLVGAGNVARVGHLPALSAMPEVVLAGVVTDPAVEAEAIARRWGFERAYPDADAMIGDARLDALYVLTPKGLHVPFIERGLAAGLPMFCEKPLATTSDDAWRLAEAAVAREQLLQVGFNRRFAEVYRIARDEVLGHSPMFLVAQKHRPDHFYRMTLENLIHMIDLVRWFGGDVADVHAIAAAADPYREDGVSVLLGYATGGAASVIGAYGVGEWEERLTVAAGGATARVDAPDSVEISRDGQTRRIEMRPRAMGWAQVTETLGFGPQARHFISCVLGRERPETDARDAARTQDLLDRVLASAGLPTTDRVEPDQGARS